MESLIGTCKVNVLALAGWFIVFYLYHGLGITLGYHRLLTHKAFAVPKWLRYLLVLGGYLSLMGAPIVWVGVHRLHHQKSDTKGDPHSPQDGFFHALGGWMDKAKNYQSDGELHRQCKDLLSDPLMRCLGDAHSLKSPIVCLTVSILFRVAIFMFFGPWVLFVNLAATAIVFLSTQLVNSVCHLPSVGYRSYETVDNSKNVWWVGLLSLGEGWHNNHHAIPTSARHGLKWYELDLSWYVVLVLEKLGLANKIICPPERVPVMPPGGTAIHVRK
ncbi:MAG: acyl-CoA desaturase [Candidatus Melainabacteria bacterium]|nr:acyl-CoA desaturase [Candidatus Melainabacteria bacterium]